MSAHAMVHTCCTPPAEKERIFIEAKALGSNYIRVDIELSGIWSAPGADPDWTNVDDVIRLSKKYDLPVLAILLGSPTWADEAEYGRLSGEVAEHAAGTIDHWEIWNEPDDAGAFDAKPEQYARMLNAAYDRVKASEPGATVVLGGLQRPREPEWLQSVFDTPGADAIHKFDIANIHLRGPVGAVVSRYGEFKAWIASRGFRGPLWVTEHGYPADPAFQTDPAYKGGDASQAAYLTQSILGLGEAGAPQVFVTLYDQGPGGEYASEGVEHIDETPGGDFPASHRLSFAAVRRVADDWDQLIDWRSQQRDEERDQRVEQAQAALWASDARTARDKFREARLRVHAAQDDLARPRLPARIQERLSLRLARARALAAGTHVAFLWKSAFASWHSRLAYDHAVGVAILKKKIAGG